MKKLFLIICLTTASLNAMERGLEVANQTDCTVDINSPSLSKDIVNTVGNSGLIILEPNANTPEDTLFTAMRAIAKAREERIAQQQKTERLANMALAVACSGLVLTALQNIFLSTKQVN